MKIKCFFHYHFRNSKAICEIAIIPVFFPKKLKGVLIILAAGSSSRFQSNKLLADFRQHVLIDHTLEVTKALPLDKYVVTGKYHNSLKQHIQDPFNIIYNEDFQSGMGNSIAFAMSYLKDEKYDFCIICLADQPFVNTKLMTDLIGAYAQNREIVVSKYLQSSGPPCVFDSKYFKELIKLKGDDGAKNIIRKYRSKVKFVSFPEGNYDIDTPSDLEKYAKDNFS